ncbi:nucleotidyltransferase family protein [Microbacterium sp. 1P10UB]|uniref:nucleotidyltransferase family protein n=1 Tax=unclassified Microbacterium TaxID=2609290 RepID=UPI0039A3D886
MPDGAGVVDVRSAGGTATPVAELSLAAAVELGHAWLQAAADRAGIRALLIKGPALHRHGLRPPRTSGDIDVLVDPAAFDELCEAVMSAGWRERDSTVLGRHMAKHSRTFLHDRWPCDIDVHRFYPGMLAPPEVTFDPLWSRRTLMDFAHRDCAVPDRTGSFLILALHSMRGTDRQQRHEQELANLLRIDLTSGEREDIAELARLTGSAQTLAPVLSSLGISPGDDASAVDPAQLRAWRERVDAHSGAYFWISAFRRASVPERWQILRAAVWPSAADLRLALPHVGTDLRSMTVARVARWGRGIRSLPRAVRAIRAHRRDR